MKNIVFLYWRYHFDTDANYDFNWNWTCQSRRISCHRHWFEGISSTKNLNLFRWEPQRDRCFQFKWVSNLNARALGMKPPLNWKYSIDAPFYIDKHPPLRGTVFLFNFRSEHIFILSQFLCKNYEGNSNFLTFLEILNEFLSFSRGKLIKLSQFILFLVNFNHFCRFLCKF